MSVESPPSTRVLRSCYVPHDGWLGLFAYRILRAGHLETGPEHRISRRDIPGHEFLFCVRGHGSVTVGGQSHRVGPGRLAWLPVRDSHAHSPDPEDPWEILWIRVDSANLTRLMTVLAVQDDPVFRFDDPTAVRALFEAVLSHLEPGSLADYASCDRLVASLLEALLKSRSNRVLEPQVAGHRGLGHLMAQIHIHYNDRWGIDRLAAVCRVSKSHLFRLFRAAFDKTPLNWLRDYRIAQAKRMLVETDTPIAVIASQVGYADPLYFSRDFKKQTGVSPRAFRATEH